MSPKQPPQLEVWGGVECTVNRVGDQYFDQLALSGHAGRRDDLRDFAALGLKTLRFPAIWERACAQTDGRFDWQWLDDRLEFIRELGIRPIVGFVHHDSGPRSTGLLDPDFPAKLAEYAAAFADRFPWIDAYTPINEPLTTARFSGLYGLWYPHARDNASFLKMLIHQCQAVQMAMAAVKSVRGAAQLVQTEDLGKVFSTPFMAYQAAFENERRWLSLDMLTGRFAPGHALWTFCVQAGLTFAYLDKAQDVVCCPDIIGINHYVTSNRFLDERLDRCPTHFHGNNGRHVYADIEAVRVGAESVADPGSLLREVWDRFQLPLAITEVHIGCSHDEQARWLHEAWAVAQRLRAEGVDLRAVTAWSLLGSFDWDSLVTQANGRYESGVFDIRSQPPRRTILADMVAGLCSNGRFDHPVLDVPGWWHRPERLLYPPSNLEETRATSVAVNRCLHPRQLVIVGDKGPLSMAFAYLCEKRGLSHQILSTASFAKNCVHGLDERLKSLRPWAVVNASSGVFSSDTPSSEESAHRLIHFPAALARVCKDLHFRLLSLSSSTVFAPQPNGESGQHGDGYDEQAKVAPLSSHGQMQAEGERRVFANSDGALIIRTSMVYGPWDETNFMTLGLRTIARGSVLLANADVLEAPTYIPDLVNAALDLLVDSASGIWHLTNQGAATAVAVLRQAAILYGLDPALIKANDLSVLGPVTRNSLTSRRGVLLPPWQQALDRYRSECRVYIGK